MKEKIISLLLILLLVFSLCSCSSGSSSRHSQQSGSDQKETLPVLKIGSSSYPPYFYVNENGNYAGIDKEIAEEACRRLHYKPVFRELTWAEQTRKLKKGSIDCIWGGFAMNGREDEYLWAGPYLLSPITVCVRADSDIYRFEDLRQKKISVLVNSRGEYFFLNQPYSSEIQVYSYSSLQLAFAAFNKGYTDAVVGHQTGLEEYTQDTPKLYRYLDTPVHIAQLGVAFRKNSQPEFADKLTQTLNEMNADGTIPSIAKKYGLNASNILEVTSDGK